MDTTSALDSWPEEPAERLHGIEIIERSSVRAVAEMVVRGDQLNAHGICHGGVLFLLADTAMAHASNAAASAVASHAEIDFLEPVPPGARLRATAALRRRRRKLALWDVAVELVDDDGVRRPVAEFRGRTIEIAEPS